MLARNLWLKVEFFNGIRREIVDIVWTQRQRAQALPRFVVAEPERCTGPAWPLDSSYEGRVSIAPIETISNATGDDNNQAKSLQWLPLALYGIFAMLKSRRQTV